MEMGVVKNDFLLILESNNLFYSISRAKNIAIDTNLDIITRNQNSQYFHSICPYMEMGVVKNDFRSLLESYNLFYSISRAKKHKNLHLSL